MSKFDPILEQKFKAAKVNGESKASVRSKDTFQKAMKAEHEAFDELRKAKAALEAGEQELTERTAQKKQNKKLITQSQENLKALQKDFQEAKKGRKEARLNLDQASADRLHWINEDATRPRKYGPDQAPELFEVTKNNEDAKAVVTTAQRRLKNSKKM